MNDTPGGETNMSVANCLYSCQRDGYLLAGIEDVNQCCKLPVACDGLIFSDHHQLVATSSPTARYLLMVAPRLVTCLVQATAPVRLLSTVQLVIY